MSELSPNKVLCVGAHPDDIEFIAGGSVAKWVAAGAEVTYLICTNGCKGTRNDTTKPEEVTKTRQQEARAAADLLNVKEVCFLEHNDGELICNLELKKQIVAIVRKYKPDTVVTFDPTFFYSLEHNIVNHKDHRAVAEATMDAVYPLARDDLSFPESADEFGSHKVTRILMHNPDKSNLEIDIADYFDKKVEAMSAHQSQVKDAASVRTMFKDLFCKDGRCTETFVCLNLT